MKFFGFLLSLGAIGGILFYVLTQTDEAQKLDVINLDNLLERVNVSLAEADSMQSLKTMTASDINRSQFWTRAVAIDDQDDGSLIGFFDENKDGEMQDEEEEFFLIEVDRAGQRLIATDSRFGYARDLSYIDTEDGNDADSDSSDTEEKSDAEISGLLKEFFKRQDDAGIAPSRFSNRQMSADSYFEEARTKVRESRKI